MPKFTPKKQPIYYQQTKMNANESLTCEFLYDIESSLYLNCVFFNSYKFLKRISLLIVQFQIA